MEKLTNPDYLFCELPIKDGSINDNRQFIYCTKYLSLIEIIAEDDMLAAFPSEQFQKRYTYFDETFLLVFTQNNIAMVNDAISEIGVIKGNIIIKTEAQIMDESWDFYKKYLIWEDTNF